MLTLKQPPSSDGRTSPILAALLFLLLFAGVSWAEIIPASRTAPWQGNVGVPESIPNRTRIYKNVVTDLGADPKGATDCSSIIQNAIDKCPKDQVVYIPEGTFRVATLLHFGKDKSNSTLRGAGMGRTILFSANNNPIFSVGTLTWPPADKSQDNWVPISSGATKGSNTITVGNTAAFVVGAPIAIAPNPLPPWAHNLGGFPDTFRSMRVYFKVRSKTSSTVVFDPPCPFDFSGMNPMALADPTPMVEGVGLESLTLDMSKSTATMPIWIQQAWGCWVKEVEIKGAYSRQMRWDMVVRCEVRSCYTHEARGDGPNHEGIGFNLASWNLIEDNVCNSGGFPAIVLEDGINPASCNVIGYNYIVNNPHWDIDLNHGSGSILNLVEGNVIGKFEDDNYFGSSSYNTIFRNRISGQVALKHFALYYNIVGNVLGDTWVNAYETDAFRYWSKGVKPVYELGFPNIGNDSYAGTIGPTDSPDYSKLPNTLDGCQQLDRNVKATILRHGNWDAAHKDVVWDASISDHTIPNSLYLKGKPSWWGELPWPPIGPDRSPMTGLIPAQKRFEMGSLTPTPGPAATVAPTTAPRPSATPSSTQSPQVKKRGKKVKTGKWGRAKKNSGNQMPEGQEDISH
jgi:Endopolygalacturonase